MNYYYELSEASAEGGHRNFVQYDIPTTMDRQWVPGSEQLMRRADRIWREDDHGVRYIKHRYKNSLTETVDMKEFFWVKLKSVQV